MTVDTNQILGLFQGRPAQRGPAAAARMGSTRRVLSIIAAGLGVSMLAGADSPAGCGVGGAQRAAVLERSSSGPGDGSTLRLRAKLRGFEETPAISTTGTGRFLAELSGDGQSLSFELTYADLQGDAGGAVTGAHVHLGQKGVAGGIAIHLCGGGGGTDPCPAPPATLTGTLAADDVVGPAGQGIAAGEFEELLRAARAGVTYVNVHTTGFPGGEIRGQLKAHGDDGEPDDHDDD